MVYFLQKHVRITIYDLEVMNWRCVEYIVRSRQRQRKSEIYSEEQLTRCSKQIWWHPNPRNPSTRVHPWPGRRWNEWPGATRGAPLSNSWSIAAKSWHGFLALMHARPGDHWHPVEPRGGSDTWRYRHMLWQVPSSIASIRPQQQPQQQCRNKRNHTST